ncbi:MAG: DbpA RNA binding domain-containing protein, partial [Hymenobacteraceae bacterium]|nr:DbpA RNA binding domain-containing protein [Hymenobacteraceae bacterium]
ATAEGMDRLFITIGKKDRVHPRDIIDLLSQNASIPSSRVGDIDLYDKFSFVEVPTEYTAEILDRVGRIEVDGRMVIVEKSDKKGSKERSRDGGGEDFGFSNRSGGERRRSSGGSFRDRDRDRGGDRGGRRGDRESRGGDRDSRGGGGFRRRRF